MQLYYGSSSVFSFLQQLFRFLSTHPLTASSIRGTDAISAFSYSKIFFGADGRETDSRLHRTDLGSSVDLALLSPDLATLFFGSYLSTMYYFLPFCEAHALRGIFSAAFPFSASEFRRPIDGILIIAILAIGATLTEHVSWADLLNRQAEIDFAAWDETVNLRSVQISMVLPEYRCICGRPNSAMLTVGAAVGNAYAIGLHRDADHTNPQQDTNSRLSERRSTFWSLYAYERNLSLSQGRPASINDIDVDVTYPPSKSHLDALVKLARSRTRSTIASILTGRLIVWTFVQR
jgi:hypothetical protein